MIHQIYLQDTQFLDTKRTEYDWGASWKKWNPDYKHKIWNDNEIMELMKLNPEYNQYLKYYRTLQKWISKLDFAKYMLLYEFGGIYADLDTVCLKSMDPILNELNTNSHIEVILSECDSSVQKLFIKKIYGLKYSTAIVNTGIMISIKKSSFLKKVLDDIVEKNKQIYTDYENVMFIGPMIITKLLESNEKYKVKILPCDILESASQTINSYSVHKHLKSWDSDKQLKTIMKTAPYYPIFLVLLPITMIMISVVLYKYMYYNMEMITVKYNNFIIIAIVIVLIGGFMLFDKLLINYYKESFSKPPIYMELPDNDRIYNVESESFKFLKDLQVNWSIIKEEALEVYRNAPLLDINRSQNEWNRLTRKLTEKVYSNYGWIKAWSTESTDPNVKWLNYGLYHQSNGWFNKNTEKCPKTYELLKKMEPRINIAGFSLMKGISRIDPHTDSTGKKTNSLGYHLGLVVPDPEGSCTLVVDNYTINQKEGQVIIFDSNYTHYAINDSTQDRIILYLDFKT